MEIKKEEHYNELVFVNLDTEKLRKEECLCLHCNDMKTNCGFAQMLFSVCKDGNIALMVTRCRQFNEVK